MTKKRREQGAQFKFRAALQAAKEQKSISEVAREYQVHPTPAWSRFSARLSWHGNPSA